MQLFQGTHLIQPMMKGSDSSQSATVFNIADNGIPIFLYRYFMMKIVGAYKDRDNMFKLQFSKVQFIDKKGIPFYYPSNASEEHTNIVEIYDGEGLIKAITNDTTSDFPKTCFRYENELSESNPIKIVYDLKSKCLNLLTFSRWHWYTSRDTAFNRGRNIKDIRLLVSNIGDINDDSCWKEIDSAFNLENIFQDRVLAYERKTPFELY